MRRFPDNFLFGCATSAYQIEGGIRNDWTLWEEAGRLKSPDTRCGLATDHWTRWRDDFDRLAGLGARAYRFSIEWARVEPSPGTFDDRALEQYVAMVERLRALDIEPFVTLLHFTHPTWFHETTPWHAVTGRGVERFTAFAERVARAFGDRVRYWTVLNEPAVWLAGAYVAGAIPPGRRNFREVGTAFLGLIRAHAAAWRVLKRATDGRAQVGIAHNVVRFAPARRKNLGDRISARFVSDLYNHAFLRALTSGQARLAAIPGIGAGLEQTVPEATGTLDFIGINYYSRVFLELSPFSNRTAPLVSFYEDRGPHGVSDLGWEIHPDGLTDALVEMARYGLPLFVTENGLDDRDDSRRSTFLYDHLGATLEARERGVDVRGYLHWSLLDNFEWLEGFGPRFGLFEVDYATMARRRRPSADLFERIARARALEGPRPAPAIKKRPGRTPVL